MDPEVIGAVVSAMALLVATWLQLMRSHGGRSRLKTDAELLQLLPPESTARPMLLAHLDSRIIASIVGQETKRRDPNGMTIGLAMTLLAALLVYMAASGGGWWWASLALSGPIALIGIFGFVQDVRLLERDEKGRPIERKPDH